MQNTLDHTGTNKTWFDQVPRELRDHIYSLCCIGANATVSVAHGKRVPPSLARVSRKVRSEFLSIWEDRDEIGEDTRDLRLGVFDLDFGPATLAWEQAMAVVESRGFPLGSVTVAFVFEESRSVADTTESLQGLVEWCERRAKPICPDEALKWTTVDYRRYGKLKQCQLLILGTQVMICQRWRSIQPRDAWEGATFTLKMWWRKRAHGLAGGRVNAHHEAHMS